MVKKGLRVLVVFALPMAVDQFVVSYPQIAQLSIGSLLIMGLNYLKLKTNLGSKLGGLL